ncbi:phosphoglycolate phosphatase [Paraburkholderia sp. MMS20-SJTR3]|uniref:Phosphoglycolate phosphatase n=1 Tax=Paraburkholderia sejongensis TaxID=2886946 RepID=A0ABS8K4E4_9BURK|nr:phosphoglycolate phosphatase [Paraburkholderia sp. MMS20-SJTR3]MCC8397016.1 phosphoglycolate phosphatase [Paraburkholderia sp. MMS20-SJTR3]
MALKRLYDAVLIDLDGTMVDTAPDIAAAANRMLQEFDAAPLPFDTVTGFIGNGVRNLVRRCLHATGLDARIDLEHAHAVFGRHYAQTNGRLGRVFPGVASGLRALRQHGYRCACVTNKPGALAAALLENSGLAVFLDVLVAGDTLASMKPSPEPLWHACRLLGAQPARSVLVGDSPVDVAAARAAGLPVVIAGYGYAHGEAGALRGDALIDSFDELPVLLARLMPVIAQLNADASVK